MKRIHINIAVKNISHSKDFYSAILGVEPIVEKPDYVKWKSDDPMINLSISDRATKKGVDHLGIQVESSDELQMLHNRAVKADIAATEQSDATCCYALSDKYWLNDPQGVEWEMFHSRGAIESFSGDGDEQSTGQSVACCTKDSDSCC